jgi:hypothetical protein
VAPDDRPRDLRRADENARPAATARAGGSRRLPPASRGRPRTLLPLGGDAGNALTRVLRHLARAARARRGHQRCRARRDCRVRGRAPPLRPRPADAGAATGARRPPRLRARRPHAHASRLAGLPTRGRPAEIAGGAEWLRARVGVDGEQFAYPFGAWNGSIARLVAELGFRAAYTTDGNAISWSASPHALPRVPADSHAPGDFPRLLADPAGR